MLSIDCRINIMVLEMIEGMNQRFTRDGAAEFNRMEHIDFGAFLRYYIRERWAEVNRVN